MSEYTVLADVGHSSVRVLWQEIQTDPQVHALIDNEGLHTTHPSHPAVDQAVEVLRGMTVAETIVMAEQKGGLHA